MSKLKAPAKLSYEEFLNWCDEDTWAEWVDGEVVMVSPASDRHQDISDFLTTVLRLYIETRGLGIVRSAPFQMYLAQLHRGREPDLLFIAREHQHLLKETYLDGPADLVIEIISPESRLRDRGEKRAEYEAAGVREYWLLDPERKEADFYRLDERGRYRLIELQEQGSYRSEVLSGFWLKPDWLWQEPLPSPIKILTQIAGVDPKLAEQFERALSGVGGVTLQDSQ